MSDNTDLRKRKVFALIRIVGGLVSACYLGFVVLINLAGGVPFNGSLILCAIIAISGFIYASWYLRELSAIACEERMRAYKDTLPPVPNDQI